MTEQWNEEQTVTLDEVKAALEKVDDLDYAIAGAFKERVMAELRKPPIHPDVPVMYDEEGDPPNEMTTFRNIDKSVCHNIRVLMPVDTVIAKAKERDEYLHEFGPSPRFEEMLYWQSVINAYTKEGPSRE